MGNGPLDHPQLLAIEARLDAGELDEAQRLLADLGDQAPLRYATTYLATRLLYQRGKLTSLDVAQRLEELLKTGGSFPEARAMLEAARSGALERTSNYKQTTPRVVEGETAAPPLVESAPPPTQPLSRAKVTTLPATPRRSPPRTLSPPDLNIPKAPPLPTLSETTPPDASTARTTTSEPREGDTAPSPGSPTAPSFSPKPDPNEGLVLEMPEAEPAPGYYSSRPPEVEAVHARTTSHRARPGMGSKPQAQATSRSSSPQRRPPSSVRPKPQVPTDDTPTQFSVLGLLEDQRFEEALAMLERTAEPGSAEFVLMRARALLGLDRREEAVRALQRLSGAPLLEPELRAGCARLLIVADEYQAAYQQALAAYEVDSRSGAVRLALAWAAVRLARREEGTDKLRLARDLLATLDFDRGPTPALAHGLWACIELEEGAVERALGTARRALEMDADCVDALAALALGAARRGRSSESEEAWRRLLRLNSEEAHVLRPLLDRVETPIDRVRPSLAPASNEPVSRRVWDPLEAALVNGEGSALREHFEGLCTAELAKLPGSVDAQPMFLAERASKVLTRAPGWTHFAPYDLSLWSLLRLQVALNLVYGSSPSADPPPPAGPAGLLLGAYLGESVRMAHGGQWHGDLGQPNQVRVITHRGDLAPFSQMRERIAHGKRLAVDEWIDLDTAHRGTPSWSRCKKCEAAVPCPWAPMEGPELPHLAAIGRALGRSMVSLYCDRYADGGLDYSVDSLSALDSYLALLSPPNSPVDKGAASLTRAGIMVGCYLGEVMRSLAGGSWEKQGQGSARYVLKMGRVSVLPIEHVMRRLAGEHMLTLSGFVEQTNRALALA